MVKTTELESAYRATTYRLFLPGGGCELRVGVASDTLRCWLETADVMTFAVLTAHNPGSRLIDPNENIQRQAKLECDLLELGYESYAGENVAADENWPAEESCFVPGISLVDAKALGERYGQNAILCGGADGLPELTWLETTF